ncbi:site-specific tyrosine recombinase XerC [Achromobacter xylosoxidans]|nr:site-specific tyrosine recombinase XerC [Achromobacter xylosoxidans]CUK05869.1 site-specific tyrosine recombinase XerC [Achromobacter xylosoxidans]
MLARLPPAARADRAQLRFSHSAVKPRPRMPPLQPPSPLPLPAAPSPAATPLDPSALDPATEAAVRALLREGSSANTESAYRAAMRYWAAWFALRFGQPLALPVAAPAVVRFVVDHLQVQGTDGLRHGLPDDIDRRLVAQGVKARPGPLSLNTVLHRIAVLSKAHALQDLVNPCRNEQVATLLARARRAYARRGALPVRKPALTKAPLQALLDTCDDSLEGLRDRALLLFAWASGGRRRSEVVRATTANTLRTPQGYLYALAHSKTNQGGAARADNIKPIVGAAALALDAWLAAARITEGPLFRRVRRGGVIGEPLAAAAVRDIVVKRSRLAGLDEPFSAHSLRSGFVTEAGRQNVPLAETMAMTGHASVATVMGYHRAGAATQSRAARLLDAEDGSAPLARPADA